jgi:hypothetical protein
MSITVMKLALEALEFFSDTAICTADTDVAGEAITDLRQAIEQAEKQEPYGYFRYDIRLDAWVQSRDSNKGVAFYTTPPAYDQGWKDGYKHGAWANTAAPVQELCQYAIDVGMSEYRCVGKCQYAAPATWVGLTNEEIEQSYEKTGHYQTLRPQDRFAVFSLAKAVEAKLKEKNTP